MIIEDRLVRTRLRNHAEFLLRLEEFLHSYNLGNKPALVLQGRPAADQGELSIDFREASVIQRFASGGADRPAWWHGFKSSTQVMPTFHGVAVLSSRSEPTWASELHRDGHFIAGVWHFPDLAHGEKQVHALADFYVEAFRDFFALVEKTVGPEAKKFTYDFTASLTHAPSLYYAGLADFGRQHVILHSPLTLENIQWPVVPVVLESEELAAAASDMASALCGAYGARVPSETG